MIISFSMQCSYINKSNSLPDGIELSSNYDIGLSFVDCQNDKIQQAKASGIIIQDGFVSTYLSSYPEQVELALTNDTYDDIMNLNLRYGNYFKMNPLAELNRVIVISEQLAFKLYHTYDAVGKTVIINDVEYTVCGVYLANQSLLSRLSSSNKERIYIPYMNIPEFDKLPIKQLYIKNEESKFIQGMIQSVESPNNKTIMYDSVTDYRNIKKLIKQALHISIFTLGLNILAFICYVLIKKAKLSYNQYRLTDDKKNLFINCGICLGYVLGMIIIFIVIKFQFFIPTTMLPTDNIFDFKFYLDEIIHLVQQKNSLLIYDYHWKYSLLLIVSSFINGIVFTILSTITWWYGVYLVKKMVDRFEFAPR